MLILALTVVAIALGICVWVAAYNAGVADGRKAEQQHARLIEVSRITKRPINSFQHFLEWDVNCGYLGVRTVTLIYFYVEGKTTLYSFTVEGMQENWLPRLDETTYRDLLILAEGEANAT